ncbi:MAG: AbrB family transcriptional regulator, partial [Microcystis sp. 53602_E8]|nr:AbrB family transcriptional regulator [Microcystis sp. 53602_E8]
MSDVSPTPLTGKALLQKVKELSHLPRRETAKRCG